MSSAKKLTRAQREAIIIDFINHKETPGYKVIENANGKFTVRAIKNEPIPKEEQKPVFEIEEEDTNESHFQQDFKEDDSDDEYETLKQPPKQRTKQNARELLQQLSQLLNEDEPEQSSQGMYIEKRYSPGPQNWRRKKLIL